MDLEKSINNIIDDYEEEHDVKLNETQRAVMTLAIGVGAVSKYVIEHPETWEKILGDLEND